MLLLRALKTDEADGMTDSSEIVESIDGIPDCAARGASSIERSQGRPRVAEYLNEARAK